MVMMRCRKNSYAATMENDRSVLIPLRSWLENEAKKTTKFVVAQDAATSSSPTINNKVTKESLICQTTVAFGIVEVLKILKKGNEASGSGQSLSLEEEEIQIDNFNVVCVSNTKKNNNQRQRHNAAWDDIKGVSMLSFGLSVSIEEPSYLSCLLDGDDNDEVTMGRSLEVELTSSALPTHHNNGPSAATTAAASSSKKLTEYGERTNTSSVKKENGCNLRCLYFLARLLYEIYTHEPYDAVKLSDEDCDGKKYSQQSSSLSSSSDDKSRKKLMLSRARGDFDVQSNDDVTSKQLPHIVHMQKLGIPFSICLLIQNLLECCDYCDQHQQQQRTSSSSSHAYKSLEEVAQDLHLLLFDPDRFLFDKEINNTHINDDTVDDNIQLLYRKGKLYGRDKEETLITDTFCRVTRGKSEAFFIGGFSGSGKSMLVNTVRVRVKNVGGYVIKHKFDARHERPLSGVISAINRLCLMIKARHTPHGLVKVTKKLADEFGVDFCLLAKLLPNACDLSPEFDDGSSKKSSSIQEQAANDTMNLRSVCFTLLRFMRVVSSPLHPVMFFLDDLQWADDNALEVIHTILSDTMGSCVFFVGNYRDNEVKDDHAIFNLIEKLEISNVQTTKVSLTGLDLEDLNTMISDALCLYPRICKSLSDIVFQKTKGNPFFVLEFMQSLQSRGLLQYNFHQKRWVWNENIIRSEEITDNVLHLLSSKMNELSENVRTLLKVMACFGTRINESVLGYLSKSAEYSGMQDWLKKVVSDGFVEEDGVGNFKFVHDKVHEAAYNLIPDSDKEQFHYNLGIVVYLNCDKNEIGDTIFLIASQINHGKESILKDRELRIKAGILNMKAGKRALDRCSHKTAYSYLCTASSFLPDDHWETNYDLSLRLNFLMASAANSSYNYKEAELISQRIIEKARSTKEKLPAYFLLCTIFQTQGKVVDTYTMCSSILTRLGETMPDVVTPDSCTAMITETVNMFEEVQDDQWMKTKIQDETLRAIVRFYNCMTLAAYFFKPREIVTWFACKAAQICLRNGMCRYAPLSFLQFTVFAVNHDDVQCVFRIGKDALSLLERFDITDRIAECYFPFYSGVAWRFEPFQECADKLIQAFSSGLSAGNANIGFFSLMQAIYFYIFCGKNLRSLLVEIDYYLHLLKTYKIEMAKNYLLSSRETVSTLIDKGHATSIEAKASYGDINNPMNKQREMFFFHQAIRAYWLGHTDRFKHFNEKCLSSFGHLAQFNTFMMKFYHGLHLLETLKKKRSKEKVRLAIAAMRDAASNSKWNFQNKLELLEAEKHSFEKKHDLAIASYNASITSAKNSRFIHEQGLACEKAGFHCKKEKDVESALKYFGWAQQCYAEWGSTMKVDFIQKELDRLNPQ